MKKWQGENKVLPEFVWVTLYWPWIFCLAFASLSLFEFFLAKPKVQIRACGLELTSCRKLSSGLIVLFNGFLEPIDGDFKDFIE